MFIILDVGTWEISINCVQGLLAVDPGVYYLLMLALGLYLGSICVLGMQYVLHVEFSNCEFF